MCGLTAQDVLTVVVAMATGSVLVGTALVGTATAAFRAVTSTGRWVSRAVRASLRR